MMEEYAQYANSIFEQPWWLDIVAKDSWEEIVIEKNGEIIGRLPIVIYKKHFRTIVKMPLLTQTLGPWIKYREYQSGNEHLSLQKEVINELVDRIPKNSYFKVTMDSSNQYVLPYMWHEYRIRPTFTYQIPDLSDLDKVYQNFNKTAKKNIKTAAKKVELTTDVNPIRLIDLLEKTFKAQGRKNPIPSELINRIVEESTVRKAGKMFSAIDDEGNIHACSFFVFDKNMFYYLISGSDPKFRTSGAQSLILWEAIKYASSVSNRFDFEGSNIEGIEKFFRQFGGVPIVNYEIRKIPLIYEGYEIIKPKLKKILKYKQ